MKLVVALLLVCCSCSAIFMEKLPPTFDAKRDEPRCSATKGFVAWDGLQATGALIGSLILFAADAPVVDGMADSDAEQTLKLEGGVLALLGVIHIASAVHGNGLAEECRLARGARTREVAKRSPTPAPAPAPAIPVPQVPRGFFCSSKACDRAKAVCEQARLAAGDTSPCALVEAAICFPLEAGGSFCAPSTDECAQRRALAGDAASGECTEQK